MYRYFVQPQIDKFNAAVTGYELFMKQYTENGWRPPADFTKLPTAIIADELLKVADRLSLKMKYVAVNLNRVQLVKPEVTAAVIAVQNRVRPLRIVVEITEDRSDPVVPMGAVRAAFQQLYARGIEISLDDVDCGENTEVTSVPLLPFVDEIKFAIQNFDQGFANPIVPRRISFWTSVAHQNHLRFVLEGIEDRHDDQVADRMGIEYRQGYYYGRPHLLRLAASDPR
ncbi:EAL domain-containing protein [Lacticaseibacillus thailandensis]|uniref:C-di-gmp-specific phosphodiesterase n=1 Tax=Lacticaseibacillus thailandensis DSM 22698 = JCM 13996 TaxID=1423810 RepID=A0A0R2C825_9LACO|nr:EAL domain-containing protein [Lacticaseibacillus thailandensis]KRM87154.1 c-di-gmp-specific phosphodiesterase [Lacticaseibacillus thailandensis DSM 22698 = JCM 13996]